MFELKGLYSIRSSMAGKPLKDWFLVARYVW